MNKFFFSILCFVVCAAMAQTTKDAPNKQSNPLAVKLQAELDAMPREFQLGKTYPSNYLKPLGWEYKDAVGLDGHGKNWKYEYIVYKKNNFYVVLITIVDKLKKALIIEDAFLIDEIPSDYVYSLSCNRKPETKKEAYEQYCGSRSDNELNEEFKKLVPQSSGVSCGLSQYSEMLAFVSPVKQCSQTSDKFHFAYRYNNNFKKLEKIQTKGWVCNIERSRPKSCPELTQR